MAGYIDVVQLIVELDVEVPRIWRRLLVSPFTKLAGLHRVLQAALGWDPNWPHRFILRGDIYKRVEPGEALDARRERNWRLDSAWYPDHYFFYATGPQYEWRFRITEEAYIDAPVEWRYPRCVGGEGACPPGSGKAFTIASANRRIWKASPKH